MDLNKQFVLAERFENLRLVIVLAFVFIGLNNAGQAIAYHYPPAEFLWVRIAGAGLDLTLLGCCLLVLVGWFRLSRITTQVRTLLLEEFVQKVNITAMAASWFFTFLAVQAVSEWTEPDVLLFGTHDTTVLPPVKYYMHIVVSCMTLSYGLVFLFLYRKSSPGDEP